jgi:hypothetical protein
VFDGHFIGSYPSVEIAVDPGLRDMETLSPKTLEAARRDTWILGKMATGIHRGIEGR